MKYYEHFYSGVIFLKGCNTLDYHQIALTGSPGGRGPRRRADSSGRARLLITLILVIAWGGMVFGGFYYAKLYINRAIQGVQQTNSMHIQTLEGRLDNLSAELKDIENTLRSAGLTLTSSDSTQKELNRKIDKLDKQLQELEKSLKILKEAPNAAR